MEIKVELALARTGEELAARIELGMDLDADDDVPAGPARVLNACALCVLSPSAGPQA
jgi:hypothetical protein